MNMVKIIWFRTQALTPASTLVMSSTLIPANGKFAVSVGVASHRL